MSVMVKIENTYSDGHASSREVEVDAPELEFHGLDGTVGIIPDEWWDDEVFWRTGDGHGAEHPDVTALYTATIIRADVASLVGQTFEWGD